MRFFAFHPKAGYSVEPTETWLKVQGTVQEVEVVYQNSKVCSIKLLHHNLRLIVAKWPNKYFGKVRGVFEKRSLAEEYLSGPLPKFDHDGTLINKISKSDQ